ncbi:MAG: hypothetical protein JW863_18520 [Chitinispirillaceae bacterium]|nr:hypothetical protein [Chitinispirillaceae bacterium]
MKIGLTYDLRSDYLASGFSEEETAEFDSEETVSAIENALQENGFSTERIGNVFALVTSLASGNRWDMVFNITEGMFGASREAQVPSLLEAYRIPVTFSDSLIISLTHSKPVAKELVRQMGIPTPDFAVITTEEDCISNDLPPFPLFVKPVAEGTSKGIDERSRVETAEDLSAVACELIGRYHQPVLVETFLPGREVTVGITGTGSSARVAGVLEVCYREHTDHGIYSYRAKEFCEQLIDYRLATDRFADDAAEMALHIWRKLGCRDAGRIDFRADTNGMPCFLELNPLAGLHPTHSDLPIMWQLRGLRYTDLIGEIISSALRRHRQRSESSRIDAFVVPRGHME